MKRSVLALMLLAAPFVHAYEYKLQFTPQSGARGLVVAGYGFGYNRVVGDCSYYTVSAGSGRGSRGKRTNHYSTCVWDLYGNLISMTPGAAAAPSAIRQIGTETIYAVKGTSTTGRDSRGFGFVSTPSAHYAWQTLNGGYFVIPDAVYPMTMTLISDGDFPLVVAGATAAVSLSGTTSATSGKAVISANTCRRSVPVGSTCSVTVSYNPTTIGCTTSTSGYAYTKIKVSLVTDAGASSDFTKTFTITGVPICGD
jgi:hypothetical protein